MKFTIGIDWGTKSSKWTWIEDSNPHPPHIGMIHSSSLLINIPDNAIKFCSNENDEIVDEINYQRAEILKRVLIADPNTPFWDGVRDDVKMSLGYAVVFSIASLVKETLINIGTKKLNDVREICFSFPNWIPRQDKSHDIALVKLRKAARLALQILDKNFDFIPQSGDYLSIDAFVDECQNLLDRNWTPNGVKLDEITSITDQFNNTEIRYLQESIAAGLPYLLDMESKNDDEFSRLLVIDIGAGSTDIGYLTLLRSPKFNSFHFYFHKPAPTIGIAGSDITTKLKQLNGLTFREAEEEKISLSINGELKKRLPYVETEWIPSIKNAVEDYMKNIPHSVHMDQSIPVKIILSGGSSLIEGLSDSILESVNNGLRNNKNYKPLSPAKARTGEIYPVELYGRKAIDIGRRIVSIGAAQPTKKNFYSSNINK